MTYDDYVQDLRDDARYEGDDPPHRWSENREGVDVMIAHAVITGQLKLGDDE